MVRSTESWAELFCFRMIFRETGARFRNLARHSALASSFETAPRASLQLPASIAFAAKSNRLTPDTPRPLRIPFLSLRAGNAREWGSPLSTLTPLSARSQWNLGLPFAQDEGRAIRCSRTVLLSITAVSFTIFTEKSTQNLARANAFGPYRRCRIMRHLIRLRGPPRLVNQKLGSFVE